VLIVGKYFGSFGTCWGHSENLMGTSWEQKNPKDLIPAPLSSPKEKSWVTWVHSGSPHWLSRISMPTSVLYHFGRSKLMAVGHSEPVSGSSHHIKTHVLPHGHKTLDTPKPQTPRESRPNCSGGQYGLVW
jgi:hypothetical protein